MYKLNPPGACPIFGPKPMDFYGEIRRYEDSLQERIGPDGILDLRTPVERHIDEQRKQDRQSRLYLLPPDQSKGL